jgi:hypothetical protein
LHWLAAGQWHWIHTLFPRVNARACGIEWVSTPLMALTRTDRLLFLINAISFLLLPGLIFSVFTRLGVRPRAAWHWMWIVPTGYCFLLQAGSIGNDLFGAPFALAALDFALRAKTSSSSRYFHASVLAAALMTSAKTSDLPLLLPWGLAILPSWQWVFRQPLRLAAVGVIAFGASFLPTALLNAHYCQDWTGWKSEGTCVKSNPPLRLADNLALITLVNLTPPVFPLAGAWNQAVRHHLPAELSLRLHQTVVEPEVAEFKLEEMQMEESAGLGFGVTVLLILSVGATLRFPSAVARAPSSIWLTSVRLAPLVSLLALLSQSEVYPISRILAPYYALLLPALLAGPGQERLVRRRWWRAAAGMVCLLALGLVITTPPRPLFPIRQVLAGLQARHPESAALKRAETVYAVYQERSDAFAPALSGLPPGITTLGLFTYDDPETSLWRPFGSRRIEHVRPEDTAEDLSRRGIQYILIPPGKFERYFNVTPEAWVHRLNGVVIRNIPLQLRVSEGTTEWWLVKLP